MSVTVSPAAANRPREWATNTATSSRYWPSSSGIPSRASPTSSSKRSRGTSITDGTLGGRHEDPARAPLADLVAAVEALGDHARQTLGACRLQECRPVAGVVRRRLPVGTGQLEALQPLAALVVRELRRRVPVAVQDVEEHDRHG